jgi:hypothetical protein
VNDLGQFPPIQSKTAGNAEFTQAKGISDLFEESVYMNNAQLHVWATKSNNEKEMTLKRQTRNLTVLSDTKVSEPASEELDSSWSCLITRC